MMASRRRFLATLSASSFALGAAITDCGESSAEVASLAQISASTDPRPTSLKPVVSHLGYRLYGPKHVMVSGLSQATEVQIIRMGGKGDVAFTARLQPTGEDFGEWLIADFSELTEPGIYRASVVFQMFSPLPGSFPGSSYSDWFKGKLAAWTQDFAIGDRVWDEALRSMVSYYRIQSCGASKSGYNTPCHTGPISRTDGAPAQPVTGGWHSADDHVRPLPEILHGMFGLLALAESRPDLESELDLFEQVRWGNDYFLSVQDSRGYVYFGVYPKDYFKMSDTWSTASYVLHTEPAPRYCQYMFMAIQAKLARIYQKRQPDYAMRCLRSAHRCFEYWASRPDGDWGTEKNMYELGTEALAAASMFQTTGEEPYRTAAREFANALMVLQSEDGYWPENRGKEQGSSPDYNLLNARALYTALAPIGLCEVLRTLPDDPAAEKWKSSLLRFADVFAPRFAEANGFGLLPQSVYNRPATLGKRAWGQKSYRYFMGSHNILRCPGAEPIPWEAGNHGIVAGYGVALHSIGRLLAHRDALRLAGRQLDWIFGLNPLDSCQVLGFGRNNPIPYPAIDFAPHVPDIRGAVFQGMVGEDADMPTLVGGYYATGEFWMPQHSWTLWLTAVLSADIQSSG